MLFIRNKMCWQTNCQRILLSFIFYCFSIQLIELDESLMILALSCDIRIFQSLNFRFLFTSFSCTSELEKNTVKPVILIMELCLKRRRIMVHAKRIQHGYNTEGILQNGNLSKTDFLHPLLFRRRRCYCILVYRILIQ